MLCYEQEVSIQSNATTVERCFTDRGLMHQWLNPALRCDPVGERWSTEVGSQTRFVMQIPLWSPSLLSTVIERRPGLVIWAFDGFFQGQDRWECWPEGRGTRLLNRFEFDIPNPLVAFGFQQFASRWTQADMTAQLQRLKQVAERL
ncbi:MAG: SRPBCC family protein [Cyanobacteria bacterium J06632_22]